MDFGETDEKLILRDASASHSKVAVLEIECFQVLCGHRWWRCNVLPQRNEAVDHRWTDGLEKNRKSESAIRHKKKKGKRACGSALNL